MSLDVSDTLPRAHYVATAAQTVFSVPFEFELSENLEVYVDGVLKVYADPPANANEFSTTNEGVTGGGTIVFGAPGRLVGEKVVILNAIPMERLSDYPTTGIFPVAELNADLDRYTMLLLQVDARQKKRSLTLEEWDDPAEMEPLPLKADRASKILGFDADGDPAMTDPSVVGAANAAAAAASAAAALVSQTSASTSATNAGTSAGAASTSASNASTSATAASNSAAAAAASAASIVPATLLDRANHTGTQLAATISNFSTAADARISAAVGVTVQAYNALLASWAGITRASGFDTFAATPSSANLRALLTDEVGTGAAYFVGGALGTPASATLTNATGLPLGGLVASTSLAIGVGTVELGHATDTTLSRGAAGFAAVEGKRVPSPASQASGDLLYRGATEWERLAKGTALQVLRMNSTAAAPEWAVDREVLTAARTYYVRTDGSDANTGLVDSAGGAFLTIQKAIDVVGALDISIYDVTIQVRDGTYTGAVVVIGSWVGVGTVTLQGNAATPANVLLNVTGVPVTVRHGRLTVKDLKLQATSHGFLASLGGKINFSNVNFGACTGAHMRAEDGAAITADGNYAISGAAAQHWRIVANSVLRAVVKTITITGTPALATFASVQAGAQAIVNGNTFSGAATGIRYTITENAVVSTAGGGATYLPGDVAGSTATGGQYI